jgi:hypothetical protein
MTKNAGSRVPPRKTSECNSRFVFAFSVTSSPWKVGGVALKRSYMHMIPREITLSCGCTATWNDIEGQYNAIHTCNQKQRQMEQRRALQHSADESKRRQDAPLYRKPFSLLR